MTRSYVGVALRQLGHDVHFLTSHHDPSHCFKETHDGSLNVTVVADWFPRNIFGKCYALCAYIRMILAVLYMLFLAPIDEELGDYDVVVCDQISAPIPLIKWFSHYRNLRTPKIIFYCHFPDKMLTKRENLLKKLYRKPIDFVEEWTTGSADVILVNSKFTADIFKKAFKSLLNKPLQVLYPTSNFAIFDRPLTTSFDLKVKRNIDISFLSINRYERKKNLNLALKALEIVLETLRKSGSTRNVHLVFAGGYDERLPENREHFDELVNLAAKLKVEDCVSFMKSPCDSTKHSLLHNCTAVIYTPENEHFGIVPLEAMYMKRPVIACNSGGPLETVVHEETGLHCEPNADSFANAMMRFINDKSLAREYGVAGHEHVKRNFSYVTFKNQLNNLINSL